MSPQEVETDGFEIGEVLTGPDDCQIILNYDRCLEDVTELAITACKHTIHMLAASAQKPNSNQVSLEDFLHPTTFYLQLRTMDGKLQAVRIDDSPEPACMHEPVYLEIDHMARSVPAPTPSVVIEFIEDLFMGRVLKVSKNGEVYVFKSATHGNEDQLKREINVLQQISEKWDPDHPERPHVPQFFGLVKSSGQVIGMLENFIEGKNLYELNLDDASSAQRRKWKRQIDQAITRLH